MCLRILTSQWFFSLTTTESSDFSSFLATTVTSLVSRGRKANRNFTLFDKFFIPGSTKKVELCLYQENSLFFNIDMTEEDVGEEGRTVVCQGAAVIRKGWKRKKRYLTLFNDVFVVSSKLNKKKFKIKHVIPLAYLWIGDEVDAFRSDNTAASKSIYLYWPMGHVVATFRSIREAKKHNTMELPMRIFTEDIAGCDTPLYLTATNYNTVNDIISKFLSMIRKQNTEDYQLWFCPGPGEAPRALQGHEYPHDIRMINIQKNFSSRNLRNLTDFPSLPGVIMKYLNADKHGKFILKPRNSARSQQHKRHAVHTKKERAHNQECFYRTSEYNFVPNSKGQIGFRRRGGYKQANQFM
eukprot:XP_017451457.1 PREDICTED: rho GTPase-activating protein 20-like isoform X2 [Rattus norvegicus]